MKKDSRLSFRLSNNLSGKIQKIIDDSNGEIRDRSEFGTKAVEFYLNSLTNSISRKLTIINALISIIDTEKLTDPDILKAKEELEAIAIKIEDSGRIRDDHPKYAELILLKTVFDRSVQREMKYEIRSATYSEIGAIHRKYYEKYMNERGDIVKPRKRGRPRRRIKLAPLEE